MKKMSYAYTRGDKTCSMYKQWGQRDESLIRIYPLYKDTIIRSAKFCRLTKHNKIENSKTFRNISYI